MLRTQIGIHASKASELDAQDPSEDLQKTFQEHGIKLSAESKIEVKKRGREWLIRTGPEDKQYRVLYGQSWTFFNVVFERWKLIKPWHSLRWPWSSLSVSEVLDEDRGTISSSLREACANQVITLSENASIRSRTAGKEWILSDPGDNLHQSSNVFPSFNAYRVTCMLGGFRVKDFRDKRAYSTTPLPTIERTATVTEVPSVLLSLYVEICNSWRQLTEVRFKLLGLVPTISVTILITLLARAKDGEGLTHLTETMVVIFGLFITFALFIYEQRNSELYDDLVEAWS